MADMFLIRISGKAMEGIRGSELSLDPVRYDGGTDGSRDAFAAITASQPRRNGRGWLYPVMVTRAGAETIREFCQTVGSTFVTLEEAEDRADGRALLKVAETIRRELEKAND